MYGPSLPSTRRLRSRMFANVPRIITSWCPRRAPYELKSRGATPCAWSHWPAGDHAAIDPAGLMWSVVTESPRSARTRAPSMSRERRGLGGQAVEERRIRDVRRAVLPRVAVALRDRQRAPALVALEHRRVGLAEQRGIHGRADDLADLGGGRPDVGEHHRIAVAVRAQRLGREVDVDAARERERDDERRRREIRGADEGMDATLEVAVARQDCRDHELVVLDGLRDRLVERPAVADARRAAIAREREAELGERRHQPGPLEVAGDGLGARGERGLDDGRDASGRARRRSGRAARRRPSPSGWRCSCTR